MVELTLICYDGNKKLKIWKKAILNLYGLNG